MTMCQKKLETLKNEEDIILSCLTTSFSSNLCLFSNNQDIGYTYISQKRPMKIYGTSNLSLLGKSPKWILAYNLYENQQGQFYCKIANEVTFQFLKLTVDPYVFQKFKLAEAELENPFYKEINLQLQSFIIEKLKSIYYKR